MLEGNIKIGTLYSYRDSELEKGISDLNEGIKTVSYQFSENAVIGANHNNPDNKDYIASSQFGVAYADETSLIHLGNAQTSKVIESENFSSYAYQESKMHNLKMQIMIAVFILLMIIFLRN